MTSPDPWLQGAGIDEAGRFVLASLPDVVLLLDGGGVLRFAGGAIDETLGYEPADQLGTSVFDKVHPDDVEYALGALSEVVRKVGGHAPVQLRVRHADGHWVDVELSASTPVAPSGEQLAVLSLRPLAFRDLLPERRRRLERLVQDVARTCAAARSADLDAVIGRALADLGAFFAADSVLLEAVDHGHALVHLDHEWTAVGVPSARAYQPEVPLGDLLWDARSRASEWFVLVEDLREPLPGAGHQLELLTALGVRAVADVPITSGQVLIGILSVRWNRPHPFEWDDADAGLLRTLGDVLSVTVQRLHAERQLQQQALHDQLTGLPNRAALGSAMRPALARLARHRGVVAVLFADLNGFKAVNDEHGHDVGDRVLVEVARRVQGAVRPADTVCRLGGDEFVVLCQDLSSPAEAHAVAQRIRDEVAGLRQVDGFELRLGASVGVAWTDAPTDPDDLLREADRSMYEAKPR
ncbi:MAG: diguanylate cyclase [Acidimicrobiales bacterium]|nr:diguanylate cyclase [Acidimicrobiales bacterium]